MGSARQDRSLGGGISLPQWMKRRNENRFDFDDSTFSPPSHDDSFLYIRCPKTENQRSVQQEYRSIKEVLNEQNIASSTSKLSEKQFDSGSKSKEVDFSKHPLPCQPFVPTSAVNKGNENKQNAKVPTTGSARTKSQGVDDGFHSEPANCAKSVVRVANHMMANMFQKQLTAEQATDLSKKGSKSLPATPLTSPIGTPEGSPKSRRRNPSNRYFTGPFLPDREKYQGGWILASILGQSREIMTPKIEEEDEASIDMSAIPSRSLNRKKSISSQNLTYVGPDDKSPEKSNVVYSNIFQAKPSELREMNFWSPTSM